MIGAERCKWKFSDFHKSLGERGAVRPFTGSEDVSKKLSALMSCYCYHDLSNGK